MRPAPRRKRVPLSPPVVARIELTPVPTPAGVVVGGASVGAVVVGAVVVEVVVVTTGSAVLVIGTTTPA